MGRPPKKRPAIERAALELFVERGVDGTSIRDIAQRAGTTEGALYRHHDSKNDLVKALFAEHCESFAEIIRTVEELEPSFEGRIRRFVEAIFHAYDRDPYPFRFVMVVRHHLLEDHCTEEHDLGVILANLVSRGIRNGEVPEQDPNLTAQMMLGMVLQAADAESRGRLNSNLSSHAEQVATSCLLVAQGAVGVDE